ncbi:MAG: helix-turn-helix domain-containing protein [Verrucomicrobiae bacterium]|nr:helix-turn-helix domain-containing protein [Verrucomicrobiae bacterium]
MTTKLTTGDLDDLTMKARIAENAARLTWLKPCEAACYMNIGESTLWKLLAEGTIPSSKAGGNVRIARTDIDAYWAKRRRGSTAEGGCEK